MTQLRDIRHGLSLCAYELRKATEAAARAVFAQRGRGDRAPIDESAQAALEAILSAQGINARIIAGNSERPDNPVRLGNPAHLPAWDLVMDAAEGAGFLAEGMTNALSCLALAPAGTMFDPGPAFYMEKLVAPPAARHQVDPAAPVETQLATLARCLGKTVGELTIYVLEKPRHRTLVERILAQGAKVALYPAGDVAGAVLAATPDSGIDALMGTGGAPEGLLAACAAKVMGSTFLARLNPQLATERQAVAEAGLDTENWMELDQIIAADDVVFCATGITSGLLLGGIERRGDCDITHSLLVGGGAGMRQELTSWHASA